MTVPINDSWTIARSALLTHQQRLAVTSNNIANVDTPGYHRRSVILAPVKETPPNINEIRSWSNGAGVRVANIVRSYNAMAASMLRQQSGDAAAHETRADALGGLESLMREEGDSALGSRLDAFWNAWYDLSNQADNGGFRSVVIQRGVELASHLNSLDRRVDQFQNHVLSGVPGDYSGTLPMDIAELNRLSEELQDLNMRISYSSSSFEPHELMDRREIVLRAMSELADIKVGGDFAVTLDGQTVVSANGGIREALNLSDAGPPPVFELDGSAVSVLSGKIGAWVDVIGISESLRERLDILAGELAAAVNTVHNSDLNPEGDSFDLDGQRCDWDFFAGVSASDIAVNTLIYNPADPMSMNLRLIAAAASFYDDGEGTTGPNQGDGTRALQIAELAEGTYVALNAQGFGAYHSTGLTLLGGVISTEQALADNGKAIINALEDALQAETGVNLDEELMDMMQAQRAFQAAAKLLNTIDEMMLTIMQIK